MTYKAGIIGTGGVAGMGILGMHDAEDIGRKKIRASHAGGYDAVGMIELVAILDIDSDKLTRIVDAWDIGPNRRYDDHRAMLEAEDLDVDRYRNANARADAPPAPWRLSGG
jgi:predicted dehydrogenase